MAKLFKEVELVRYFDYLAARWQDEQAYEDFREYVEAFRKKLPKGATLVSLTEDPFVAEYSFRGKKFRLRIEGNNIVHEEVQ